jgi:hypothetical protein
MSTALALKECADLVTDPTSPEFRAHVESGAVTLARLFHETTADMRRLWGEFQTRCDRLDEELTDPEAQYTHRHFDVGLYYDGSRRCDYGDKKAIDEIIGKMNVKVWEILINRMGIKSLMSIKRREEFEAQLQNGDVPEVTAEAILGLVLGLADRASEYATEAARETLAMLTPSRSEYKTMSGFKVGKRVILPWTVERTWGGQSFRVSYNSDKKIVSLDGTFHVLDGKGVMREHPSPLARAIKAAPDGKGETDYFRFRCFKNRNLHIEFRRLDLVKKLNGLATGEFVLGQDID